MSVYQVEEYYVWIPLKGHLEVSERQDIKLDLSREGLDDYSLSNDDLTVDGFDSESDAEAFNETFTEKFSNLIK